MSLRELVRLARHRLEGKSMKNYICKYKTPEGFDDLVMCGDDEALTGLWFEGSRDDVHQARGTPATSTRLTTMSLKAARRF